MTYFDEAEALAGLLSMREMTQSELAAMMGTSQSYIANKLRLLKLSRESRELILSCRLSERHARAVLRIKDESARLEAIRKIADMRLTVAASEAMIDASLLEEMPKKLCTGGTHLGLERFERVLREALFSLRTLGIDAELRTSFFGKTKYITIALEE